MSLAPPIAETLAQTFLPAGKLPAAFLQRLLAQYPHALRNFEREAAVLELEDRRLLAKTAPITSAIETLGHHAVHVTANAVACLGGEPKWFMATLLLPEHKTDEALAENFFQQIHHACETTAIAWCGGHAEITAAVSQPLIIGTMLGEAPRARQYGPAQIQPGDLILLAKALAVEATALIGREKFAALAEIFEADFAQRCQGFWHDPGISILQEAKVAWQVPGIHALHQPVAGGLANAMHAVLEEKKLGVELVSAHIPLYPETKLLCEKFQLDPLGLNAAGALLVVGEAEACAQALRHYHAANIPAALIGRVLLEEEGRWLLEENERIPLTLFPRDEIFRAL